MARVPHALRAARRPADHRGGRPPVGLATVQTSYGALYAQQMAIAVLGALPLLIAFVLFQRQIVQGIANTGLKG